MHILCVQLLACADRSCSRIAVVRQPRMIQQWDLFLSVFFFSVCVCRLNDSYRLPHRVVWHTHNLCVIDSREVKKNQQAIGLYFFLLLSFSLLWSFHVEWKPLQIRIQYRGEDIKCIYVLVVFASVFNFVFIML